MQTLLLICCLLLSAFNTYAFCLKNDAPKQYTVKQGDTLWSIANQYLKRPWEWKALWHANPHIKNPSRLYPGAVLALRYNNNLPYIKVLSNGTVKLSPHTRIADNDKGAVPTILLEDIRPFLNESIIMDAERDRLINAPYIVAYVGEHLMAGQGDKVYVKNLHPQPMPLDGVTNSYAIYREGGAYIHPKSKKILGYKATRIGHGLLEQGGEPAVMLLASITEGVKINDRVLPNNYPDFDLYFEPTAPSQRVRGVIIDMPGNNTQEAIGQVIAIDLGLNAGLHVGDVVAIFSRSRTVPDPQEKGVIITIPPERLGEAMIFRTFSQSSFALIVRSIRPIYLFDLVANP